MDVAQAIAIDGSGNAYITGYTDSFDFPTASAFQPQPRGGRDGFVSVLNSTGAKLLWSTYLGGNGNDFPTAIALDAAGNVHLAGWTESSNFPLKNAPATRVAVNTGSFAAKLKSDGSALIFSTYMGGSGTDLASGVAVDSSGNTYVAGSTNSPDLPTKNAIQSQLRGVTNAFIAAYDDEGGAVQSLSYLGGSRNDQGLSIAIAPSGMVFVVGSTTSSELSRKWMRFRMRAVEGRMGFLAGIALREIVDRACLCGTDWAGAGRKARRRLKPAPPALFVQHRLQVLHHRSRHNRGAFGGGVNPVRLSQLGMPPDALKQEGNARQFVLLREIDVDLLERVNVIRPVVPRQSHPGEQDFNVRQLQRLDHLLEILPRRRDRQSAEPVVPAELEDHDGRMHGQHGGKPFHAVGRRIALDAQIHHAITEARGVDQALQIVRKTLPRRHAESRGKAVAERRDHRPRIYVMRRGERGACDGKSGQEP